MQEPPNETEPQTHVLADDGTFPNNTLPLLVYPAVFGEGQARLADVFAKLFIANRWHGCWVDGVYPFHHYHSTAHEVLGACSGSAKVRLGGEQGIVAEVHAGDVIVIPAGVAHKNLGSSSDFAVTGAYPNGQDYDMCYGRDGERPRTDRNIAAVPLPQADPLFGPTGPLIRIWRDVANRIG